MLDDLASVPFTMLNWKMRRAIREAFKEEDVNFARCNDISLIIQHSRAAFTICCFYWKNGEEYAGTIFIPVTVKNADRIKPWEICPIKE